MSAQDWLRLERGEAPLIVSIPHAGTRIPEAIEAGLASPWLARKDADWWIDKLYAFAAELGATLIRTEISRTVIDVNRDPSGVSLYPGQASTELCPTTTFDGEPLWREGAAPSAGEIESRRAAWFDPYHAALKGEIERLGGGRRPTVLFEAHSIRSEIPRLFEGTLPQFNIGTNSGASCAPALSSAVEEVCAESGFRHVRDGRFKGGWTTRSYGDPAGGVHAIQLELACRGYMIEPSIPDDNNWPSPYDPVRAAPMQRHLTAILKASLAFAEGQAQPAR
ncbi:MAG: N-formylglutamate deformylase [Caulobacteraceae bacterium]